MATNQGAPAADTSGGDAYLTESTNTGIAVAMQNATVYVTETVQTGAVTAGASGIIGLAACEY